MIHEAQTQYPEPSLNNQQGDVLLFQSADGGEIAISNGVIGMDGGLSTTIYLSLFGGNLLDDGRPQNPYIWWGNLMENELAFQYRSETQYLIETVPPTSVNLRRIEEAVRRDLSWMFGEDIVSQIDIGASIPDIEVIKLVIHTVAEGVERDFEFSANWRASQ